MIEVRRLVREGRGKNATSVEAVKAIRGMLCADAADIVFQSLGSLKKSKILCRSPCTWLGGLDCWCQNLRRTICAFSPKRRSVSWPTLPGWCSTKWTILCISGERSARTGTSKMRSITEGNERNTASGVTARQSMTVGGTKFDSRHDFSKPKSWRPYSAGESHGT